MPHFNRAILADITQKGLDPTVAHGVGQDGKLASPLLEEKEEETLTEKIVLQENVNEKESESLQVEVPKKKSNRFKKKSQDS